MNTQQPSLWTVQEVADYLRCTVRHIQNLQRQGLPHIHVGRLVRFKSDDVLTFLQSNKKLSNHKNRQNLVNETVSR